ncbi:MAG TPA: hypothetical protein VLG67_04970 [Candidatus Saccharimonadales bacterium]|nr:hypothetical protein [Candidatus Saccharimonadales bacterium]
MAEGGETPQTPEQPAPTPTEASKAFLLRIAGGLSAGVSGASLNMALQANSGRTSEALVRGVTAVAAGLVSYKLINSAMTLESGNANPTGQENQEVNE